MAPKRHDNYEYDLKYEARPEQKKRRAQRNKDRRKALREGRVSKGSSIDVHHKDKSNLEDVMLLPRHRNRSIK
jgi:hypothetical protein